MYHNLLEFEQLFRKWASWHYYDIYTEMQSSGPFQKQDKNIETQNDKKMLKFFDIRQKFIWMLNKIFFYY